ncbi:MAG: glycosyltransferase [Chloroflexota bacterium]|nr:glycosyltransferase [Chloroflexota bacterium]
MTPSISIITPSYNQGRFIQRTIDSVISQGIPELEYVVVDGGSTDETIDILRSYSHQLQWTSERDQGHSDAINRGIARTAGPVVGWLNSDDIYYPNALQTVLDFFRHHPEIDVVYGDANHIDENDAIIEQYPTEVWNLERLKDVCFISQPAAFLRRRVVNAYGPLDLSLRYCMDYDYWFRLGLRGARFAYLPKLLAATRLHDDAATLAHRVACHAATNDITRRHLGRTPDRWLFNYAHAVSDSRGLQRGRPSTTLVMAMLTVYAAVRWNRAVSRSMLVTLKRWVVADAVAPLRRRVAS